MLELLAALLMSGGTPSPVAPVALICTGGGAANKVAPVGLFGSGDAGWKSGYQTNSAGFTDQVDFRLIGDGSARIRMPRAMLPSLRGGKDGWFEVRSVVVTQTAITGTIKVSLVNSPKLRINRTTGRISINGKSGDFDGTCEPFNPASAAPKF